MIIPAVSKKYRDSGAEVIEHSGRHPRKDDTHIQHRVINHILRGLHQLEKGPGEEHPRKDKESSAGRGGENGSMYGLVQILTLACPVIPGHQHVHADGQAHKQVDNQHIQGTGGAHRRQGLVPGKAAHHHNIRRVEQQLQHPGEGQRHGEPHQLAQQRALCHVDFIAAPASPGLKMEFHVISALPFHR